MVGTMSSVEPSTSETPAVMCPSQRNTPTSRCPPSQVLALPVLPPPVFLSHEPRKGPLEPVKPFS